MVTTRAGHTKNLPPPPPRDLFDCCVYRHRICNRLLLLRLCLVATIIPLANARRQVVDVDVVNVVVVVVDVIVVRRRAVAVVAIVVIVIIVVCRALSSAAAPLLSLSSIAPSPEQ